jgi:hypothetical protein
MYHSFSPGTALNCHGLFVNCVLIMMTVGSFVLFDLYVVNCKRLPMSFIVSFTVAGTLFVIVFRTVQIRCRAC